MPNSGYQVQQSLYSGLPAKTQLFKLWEVWNEGRGLLGIQQKEGTRSRCAGEALGEGLRPIHGTSRAVWHTQAVRRQPWCGICL